MRYYLYGLYETRLTLLKKLFEIIFLMNQHEEKKLKLLEQASSRKDA